MQSSPLLQQLDLCALVAEPRETNTSLEGCFQAGKPCMGSLGCLSPFTCCMQPLMVGSCPWGSLPTVPVQNVRAILITAYLCNDHRAFSTLCLSRTLHCYTPHQTTPFIAFHPPCALPLSGTWTGGVSGNHDTTWMLWRLEMSSSNPIGPLLFNSVALVLRTWAE